MKLVPLLVIALLFVAYQAYVEQSYEVSRTPAGDDGNVIMYSLTTCGYCKQKREELHKNNIRFTEYFIDVDNHRQEELNRKLANAGFQPRGYGTPIFDVYGVMMPNNPPLKEIIKQINQGMYMNKGKREGSSLAAFVESNHPAD